MIVDLLRFCLLMLLALLVGTMFGIVIGYNPETLSAQTYIEQQQNAIRSLNTLLPAMGAVVCALLLALGVIMKANVWSRFLLITAIVFVIIAGLITRFANQPINAVVMTWNPQSPPSDWIQLRNTWWFWHMLRTGVAIGALALTVGETLWARGSSPARGVIARGVRLEG